jgi:Ca2+-binding RTX toxin-like protein
MKMIENLEQRQMMSVTAYCLGPQLQIYGDDNSNDIYIERTHKNGIDQLRVKDHGNTVKMLVDSNTYVSTWPVSKIVDIYVDARGGSDKLEAASSGDSAVKQSIDWLAGDGDDRIRPGKGKDTVEGDGGIDTIDYSKYSANVEVHLDDDLPEASGRQGSDTDRDTLHDIENAIGGKGDDILVGNYKSNKLEGGAGNDFFQGELGEDDLRGGDGNDTFHIWESFDFKDKVDGGNNTDTVFGKLAKDEVNNVEIFFVNP